MCNIGLYSTAFKKNVPKMKEQRPNYAEASLRAANIVGHHTALSAVTMSMVTTHYSWILIRLSNHKAE